MKENRVSQKRSTCCGTPSSSAASDMVRNASGPLANGPIASLVVHALVDAGLHHLGGAETDHAARLDRRRLAGFRIAPHPRPLGANLKNPESGKLDGLAVL